MIGFIGLGFFIVGAGGVYAIWRAEDNASPDEAIALIAPYLLAWLSMGLGVVLGLAGLVLWVLRHIHFTV